jgi:uncharacterized Zn ribbon protein
MMNSMVDAICVQSSFKVIRLGRLTGEVRCLGRRHEVDCREDGLRVAMWLDPSSLD